MEKEPVRVEVDFPTVFVGWHGDTLLLPNDTPIQHLLARVLKKGEVVSLHIVMESHHEIRGFCEWTNLDGQYHYPCHEILSADGVCWKQDEHTKKEQEALQPKLALDSE